MLGSVRQVCLEEALSRSVLSLHADRDAFNRHRRGGHPRYAAVASRLSAYYQRAFFADHADRAIDYVNAEIASWKRALRWYRDGGVERDAARPFGDAYSAAAAAAGVGTDHGDGADAAL